MLPYDPMCALLTMCHANTTIPAEARFPSGSDHPFWRSKAANEPMYPSQRAGPHSRSRPQSPVGEKIPFSNQSEVVVPMLYPELDKDFNVRLMSGDSPSNA